MTINPISPLSLAEHVIERFALSFYLTLVKNSVQDERRIYIVSGSSVKRLG
jgi:hypothetical protein